MKITNVEVYRLDIPYRETVRVAFGSLTEANDVVVKIRSDSGQVGTGTTTPVPPYLGTTQDMLVDAIRYLTPVLVGRNPLDVEGIHAQMERTLGGNQAAKAGIDIAIYDLIGRELGLPAYQLLGGRARDDFVTDRSLSIKDPPAMAADAVKAMAEGFRAFEVHVGTKPREDVERIKAVREAVGEGPVIVADANQHWSPSEAISVIRKLEPYDIMVESPTRGLDNMAQVADAVEATIIADEACHTYHDAMEIVKRKAADAFCIKVIKAGGLYKAKKIATVAEAAGLLCRIDGIPGETKISNTAAVHLGLTIGSLLPGSGVMQHYYTCREDIVTAGGLAFKDGSVSVDDSPGLGVTYRENLFRPA
jgi:L-alanine-DL-glutamate epimerase-like enolase superfamily enzyme